MSITYRECLPSSFNDSDMEYDTFRDRVDVGEQCPNCFARHNIAVAIDMRGCVWFHCDACKHEWIDPWGQA